MARFERVLEFWFGPLDGYGLAAPQQVAKWWAKDSAFDQQIRVEFENDYVAIIAGEREHWLGGARSLLAYVIVLDQFSRNMFRGSPAMYEGDTRAVAACERALERKLDSELACAERSFLYMPLMHAEDVQRQKRCVELFRQLRAEHSDLLGAKLEAHVEAAVAHRDIVARFSRFPHRNTILGRASTPEELRFLQTPGSGF